MIPVALTPFLLMYILLNIDCFIQASFKNLSGEFLKNRDRCKKVIEVANKCAHKLVRETHPCSKQYFTKFCIKKIMSVIKKGQNSGSCSFHLIKKELKVFADILHNEIDLADINDDQIHRDSCSEEDLLASCKEMNSFDGISLQGGFDDNSKFKHERTFDASNCEKEEIDEYISDFLKCNPALPAITGSGILEAEAGNYSSNDIPQLDGSDDIDEILSANEKKVDELEQINLDEIDEAGYQKIPQLDGFEDVGEKQVEKTVFGVNCANN